MTSDRPIGLFEGFGVELEYMVVDRASLNVLPIADEVLKAAAGEYVSDVERGELAWSNELVLHLIELKTNGPARTLNGLAPLFQKQIGDINRILEAHGGRLMPSAAHPWMDCDREMKLWPHDSSPIYEAFHRIFNCRGHGWANLQSCHLNLPFRNDEEFGRLHAAIRALMPILPALSASSPILDGRPTGLMDARLREYRLNCRIIPSITGDVIPEPVFSIADYEERILKRMYRDIAAHDPEGTLQEEWLNARGAIARFERNTIEIRVLDTQECPAADLAVLDLIVRTLQALVEEQWMSYRDQQSLETRMLAGLLERATADGDRALIVEPEYLRIFGVSGTERTASALWRDIAEGLGSVPAEFEKPLRVILREGPLARRILTALGGDFSRRNMERVYAGLCDCLANSCIFGG